MARKSKLKILSWSDCAFADFLASIVWNIPAVDDVFHLISTTYNAKIMCIYYSLKVLLKIYILFISNSVGIHKSVGGVSWTQLQIHMTLTIEKTVSQNVLWWGKLWLYHGVWWEKKSLFYFVLQWYAI